VTLFGAVIDFTLHQLLPAIFVFFLFSLIYRVVGGLLKNILGHAKRLDEGVRQLVLKAFRVIIFLFAAIMILDQLGVNVTTLVAGLGIAGIALGFAARDTLENFISGITILVDQPFRVGDNIDVGDVFGTVEEITLRSTRIRTTNNEIVIFPNTSMISQKLINHTMLNTLRIEVPFGIAYKEYPQQAREVLLNLVRNDQRLHPDYPPTVVVTKLNDSSVDMKLRIFLKDPKLEIPVRLEYTEKVREALREADIEIPFPHLQLFVDEARAFERATFMQGNGSRS
jgi:small conductance mechanosensitive channel